MSSRSHIERASSHRGREIDSFVAEPFMRAAPPRSSTAQSEHRGHALSEFREEEDIDLKIGVPGWMTNRAKKVSRSLKRSVGLSTESGEAADWLLLENNIIMYATLKRMISIDKKNFNVWWSDLGLGGNGDRLGAKTLIEMHLTPQPHSVKARVQVYESKIVGLYNALSGARTKTPKQDNMLAYAMAVKDSDDYIDDNKGRSAHIMLGKRASDVGKAFRGSRSIGSHSIGEKNMV